MSITAPNDANVEGVFNSISHLTWESIILEDRLDITVGQFYVPGVIDQNDILGNDRNSFMAEALSTNPARVIPNALSGMGIGSWFMPNDRFYLGGLVTQAEASGTRLDFDRFNGNWAYMAEFGWTPSFSGWGQGNYRLSYSRIDATGAADDAESSSRGLNISVDQEVGPYLSFAFRFGDNDGKRNDVKRSMSAAVIFKHVRGFDQDELGLGVFRTEPTNKDQNAEDGLEAFWRFQLTNSTQLSPSIQLIRPSGAPSRNLESVLSIRLMVML